MANEKKLRRKNLNPIEKNLDEYAAEVATESDSDVNVITALKNLLEEIQYCNQYKMYYVRDLAIDRAIRRCNYELELVELDPELTVEEFEKAAEDLRKKHFGYLS